jgi:putative membrane protein
MTLRWLIATLHLLALPLGLGAVWVRARALRGPLDVDALKRVFAADGLWGGAAAIWLVTGILRAFTGLEKGSAYYLANPFFHMKLTGFVLIILLEIWPMVVLIRWRRKVRKGEPVDAGPARAISRLSMIEAVVVVLVVFAATALARGMRP